jgi:hypothetical protein
MPFYLITSRFVLPFIVWQKTRTEKFKNALQIILLAK